MAEIKTKLTTASVSDFLNAVEPDQKRKDSFAILEMMEEIAGEKGMMWGSSIIGFGKYHYKSQKSSQEGDWFLIGFSPRKANITLYIRHGNEEESALVEKLGKSKSGGGCMYINKLADVDQHVLKKMIKNSFEFKDRPYSV